MPIQQTNIFIIYINENQNYFDNNPCYYFFYATFLHIALTCIKGNHRLHFPLYFGSRHVHKLIFNNQN